MKRILAPIGVFLLAASFFSIFQPWGAFRDPDAFYHAKMSALFLERGIITEFPWLDLTTLGANFVNQHFLFHVLNAPFIHFLGVFHGHQIASVFFGAVFIGTFFFLLRWLKVRQPLVWTMLLMVLPPIIARLNLGKASPLALLFFFTGVVCVMKRAWKPLFFVTALYVLAHGGWPLLFIATMLLWIGELMYEHFIEGKGLTKLKLFFNKETLLSLGSLILGALFGILLHPYRAGLVRFLKTQILSIGVATPFDQVVLGIEWRPYELSAFIFDFSFLWIAALVLVFGFLFARHTRVPETTMRRGIALGLCSAMMIALTFKSRRFGEYMAPMFVLWFAVLAQAIDWKKMHEEFKRTEMHIKGLLAILLLAAFGRGMWATYIFFHTDQRAFHRFLPALEVIDEHLSSGERLYHSNWAQFPELFVHRDQYTYIAGLDPVFLLEANPELSHAYTALMVGKEGADPYEIMHNKFGSSISLLEKRTDTDLIHLLKEDERFKLLFEDEELVVFLVE